VNWPPSEVRRRVIGSVSSLASTWLITASEKVAVLCRMRKLQLPSRLELAETGRLFTGRQATAAGDLGIALLAQCLAPFVIFIVRKNGRCGRRSLPRQRPNNRLRGSPRNSSSGHVDLHGGVTRPFRPFD